MTIYRLGEHTPQVPASAYIAPQAIVIGRVTLGERVSVWPCAVLRADDDTIVIGDNTNIQDGAVLHVDPGRPMVVGPSVTVGHQAMLHGCTIGEGSLVGIQSIVYNRAVIGRHCLIGFGAVITEGKVFPDRSLIIGAPARLARTLTDEEVAGLRNGVDTYMRRGERYRNTLVPVG